MHLNNSVYTESFKAYRIFYTAIMHIFISSAPPPPPPPPKKKKNYLTLPAKLPPPHNIIIQHSHKQIFIFLFFFIFLARSIFNSFCLNNDLTTLDLKISGKSGKFDLP